MGYSLNTPPYPKSMQGVAEQMTPSRRERDDTYAEVIVECRDKWRIIRCKRGLQWIIQKRSTGRPNRGVFIGKSFHTTRQSLIEACSRLQLLDDPKILQSLLDLPERPKDFK